MKLFALCLLVLAVSAVVFCQEDSTTTERTDRNDTKPTTSEDESPKRQCPGFFRGFFNGGRNGGFGGFGFRRPQSPPPQGGDEETEFYNPNGYNPNGRRYWIPSFQGRGRGGNRGPNFGGAGPNYDIPDRGDVEFV